MRQNNVIIVICEGQSEVAYIQELNRLFREMEIKAVLLPVCVGTGFFHDVQMTYKRKRKENPRTAIRIWVDWDIYARNERDCMDNYSGKAKGIPDFYFSRQNFEDFLVTHLPKNQLDNWVNICRQHGHLESPLQADEYMELLHANIFSSYSKGMIPFELSNDMLKQMMTNQEQVDLPFHCDFAKVIRMLMG